MNLISWLILMALALVAAWAIRKIVKKKGSACGASCAGSSACTGCCGCDVFEDDDAPAKASLPAGEKPIRFVQRR